MIPETTRIAGPFDGDDTTTVFPFTFAVFSDTDVKVTQETGGVAAVLTSGYTVSINSDQDADPGGSVTLTTALPTGDTLVINGGTPYSQTTEFPDGGDFPPATLNRALDRIVIQVQQLKEILDRTITVPATSAVDPELPVPAAGQLIGWDALGEQLTNYEAGAVSGATPYMSTLLGAESATAAKFALGFGLVSVKDFGAVGDGTTDDTAAVQACVTYCLTNSKTVYFPSGYYLLTSTVTVTGRWSFTGDGVFSRVYVTDTNIAAFTFNINTTTVDNWSITNMVFQGPLTTDTDSIALRFTGDSTAYVQHGYCNAMFYGFGSAVKDEKSPRTTGTGLEAMLNWNRWDWSLLNQGVAGYWGTQGSGTGNQWCGECVVNGSGVPVLKFEGSGCVVGDIMVAGHWGNQVAGGVGVEVGASTVYRAQIALGAVQFDANCDVPLKLSSTGATKYKNIVMQGNNWGGNAALGASLQPLQRSVVQDRDTSRWEAGKTFTTNVTVLTTASLFDIDFATWGQGNFRVFLGGPVGGVGNGVAVGEFDIREGGSGSLTVTTITNRLTGSANCGAITVTTSGTKATVKATYTPSSAGTELSATIVGRGDSFKITRL